MQTASWRQQALTAALEIRRATSGTGALLMDVNIFWRTLKLAYADVNAEHNIRGALCEFFPDQDFFYRGGCRNSSFGQNRMLSLTSLSTALPYHLRFFFSYGATA